MEPYLQNIIWILTYYVPLQTTTGIIEWHVERFCRIQLIRLPDLLMRQPGCLYNAKQQSENDLLLFLFIQEKPALRENLVITAIFFVTA